MQLIHLFVTYRVTFEICQIRANCRGKKRGLESKREEKRRKEEEEERKSRVNQYEIIESIWVFKWSGENNWICSSSYHEEENES